jgi:hypothetical protein
MNLHELKEQVDNAIERATELGELSTGITVTLQLDCPEDSLWSGDDIELHYDANTNASGCVLSAVVYERRSE